MTREEAVKVLEANHYCAKHLTKTVLDTARTYSFDSYRYCRDCDAEWCAAEESARIQRRAELDEAISLLKGAQ